MDVAIMVEGLRKDYGSRKVLDGVDLTVGVGEVVALLGPNGAGKTTTVEILEGYRDATAGHVTVLGAPPGAHRERVGVVLQECGFPNHLRVGELVDAWRRYYPTPLAKGMLLDLVELGDEAGTLVRRLSGGQRRRLDFALALAGDPDVIFLDEPTTGFDPEARRRCWAAINNLASLSKTVLLTTHYLDEAAHLADRVAVLASGRIRAFGTQESLARDASLPTRVSFAADPCTYLERLGASFDGGRAIVETDDASRTVRRLLRELRDLPDLAVEPPTLEDAYLSLVGSA